MARASKRARAETNRDGAAEPELDASGTEQSTVYTMAEAAALKGVSYHTVSRAVRRNKLPAQRLGRMALISAEDLRAWRPMRERAPHKYRRRAPNPDASPAIVDLSMKDRVALSLELATFFELLHQAAVELPLPEFMALVVERLAGTLDLKRVVVWVVEQDGRTGRRLASFGPPISDSTGSGPLVDLPLLRQGLSLERTVVVPWSTFEEEGTSLDLYHLGEFLLAPLRIGGRNRGVLVGDRDGEALNLSDDQLALAQGLINQAALAVDRARLLEAERARGDQLAAILENVSEAVFASDATGRLSVINAAGRALLGIDQATVDATDDMLEIVNKVQRRSLAGELIPTEDVPLVRAARGEVVIDQRHFLITPDGVSKPISVSAQPILAATGEPRGAVAVVRDITLDQASAEHAAHQMTRLEAAAAHSGAVADIALAVNSSLDLDQSLRAAIEHMTTSLGGRHGAIYFQEGTASLVPQVAYPADVTWPVLGLMDAPSVRQAFARHEPYFLSCVQASPTERLTLGALGNGALLIAPLVAGDELVGAAFIGYAGATERPADDEFRLAATLANQCAVAIEKARLLDRVESARQRLLAVIDNLPLGVIIVEAPSGRLVLANQAAELLVGGPLPEVVTGSLTFSTADGLPLAPEQEPLSMAISRGQGRFGETLNLHRTDGTTVTVLANHVPVRDGSGRVVEAVSVLQDVAQLQALDRAKDEFLSITAHELRNPLTSLHGNLQLMQRRILNDPERDDDRRRLETILVQSDRLNQLVSRLLDVSRAELGRLDLSLAASDAAGVVRRTVEAASGLSAAHQVEAETPPVLPVIWDEVRIEQVLSNLVGNAIKYTPGGNVRITVEVTSDDMVQIGVRDHGPGIPEHVKVSLFERYVQGRRRGQSEGGGLGLGLYISRLIAQAHGGSLSATNVDDGGALFILTLPRAAQTSSPLAGTTIPTVA